MPLFIMILGFPSRRFLKVLYLIDKKAKMISINTSTDIGATVKIIGSSIFSILIATNSAINIDTIKSMTPNWPISLFPIKR